MASPIQTTIFSNQPSSASSSPGKKRTIFDISTSAAVAKPTKRKKRSLLAALMNYKTSPGHCEIQTSPDGAKRVKCAQKPGSLYSQNYLSPPVRIKYVRLNAGGDIGQYKKYLEGKTPDGLVQQDQAKLTCTVVPGGLTEEIHNQQNDFVSFLEERFQSLLPLMWDITKQKDKYVKKSSKLYKKLSPEEQATKAYEMFCNDARIPFHVDDMTKQFTVETSAFKRDGERVEPCFFDRTNRQIMDLEELRDGAVVRIGMSINTYETPAGMFGIKMRLDPYNNVLFKNGTGRTGPAESELGWQQEPSFVERNGNIYANGPSGQFLVRSPDCLSLYPLASNEGRTMNGVTIGPEAAKYGATLKETPETKDFFDHVENQCKRAVEFMFDSPNVLKSQVEAEMADAQAAADEGEDPRTLALENFMDAAKLPVQERDGQRIMKLTQRTTSAKTGAAITFQLVDTEGNMEDADGNPYTLEDLSAGDVVSMVFSISPWISPAGDAYGVSLKASPNYPIHIVERGTGAAATDLTGGNDMSFLDAI